ncbi:hypothetical protein [Corallococcus sp. Z5C101001]|uniref:hypothetical protein n=1 Tax=Corallococcus sp. Z5C101001 TaxID=2596829 RepID=UPI00117CD08C|nr:hypothetical protein [Corallococcus sp. Z5C101001]TSC33930.1 hypothetical protein FOF48_02465 [Corallococcus sp. Z5C101001]
MSAELLLAHADTHQPVLIEGLGEDAFADARPPGPAQTPKYLRAELGSLDDLLLQRWGIVVPEGPEGRHLLELVAPLRELRQREQGGEPILTLSVRSGLTGAEAHAWKAQGLGSEKVSEEDRPRYLLILGDLDAVSLEVQQALATDSLVGRIAFSDDAGYRAYVTKVLRWTEASGGAKAARLLFYTARDGTCATDLGHRKLMAPCLESSEERRRQGRLRIHPPEVLDELGYGQGTAVQRMLDFTARTEPGVLLSLSHGLGMPEQGWSSPEEQRALQGALLLTRDQRLTAEDVASVPFMSGGIWYGFACFSAGTPTRSAYAPWLRDLPSVTPNASRVVSLLPKPGERPFVSALPQAALANPAGPLAVMGHVDLAWSSSFNDHGRGRHARFFGVLGALAAGHRAGAALASLIRATNEASIVLNAGYHEERRMGDAGQLPRLPPAERAYQWLLYHDLASHVLLGDPAVRLPLAAFPGGHPGALGKHGRSRKAR